MVNLSHLKNQHCGCCCSVAKSCPTLQPDGQWPARPPCPSLSPGICPSSCPLSRWGHPAISSSAALFSFCRIQGRISHVNYFNFYPEINRNHRPDLIRGSTHLLLHQGANPTLSVWKESNPFFIHQDSVTGQDWASRHLFTEGYRKQEAVPASVGPLRNVTNNQTERYCDAILVSQKRQTSIKESCHEGALAESHRTNGTCQ